MPRPTRRRTPARTGAPGTDGPAAALRLVSGPVSVHVFDVPNPGGAANRLYIFGDEHHSYDNMCSPCAAAEGCATMTAFVRRRRAVARSRGTTLDAYMEMPYVLPNGHRRDALVAMWDRFMKRDEGASSAKYDGNKRPQGFMDRLVGKSPFYVGVFSRLYKEFGSDFYGDEGEKRTRDGARFHYCDIRHEPNVTAFLGLDPAAFHAHVRSVDAMRGFVRAFVYGADFPAEMARIFGPAAAGKLVVGEALSSLQPGGRRVVHKIAKQFHRLAQGPVKQAAKAYLDARIEEALGILRLDLGFDAGPRVYAAGPRPAEESAYDPWLPMLRSWHRQYYDVAYDLCMRLGVRVVLMDAYLVCRMLRFAAQAGSGSGGESIVYVGDAHAEFYVRMLKDHLGLRPSVCVKRATVATGGTRRCVRLDGPACAAV